MLADAYIYKFLAILSWFCYTVSESKQQSLQQKQSPDWSVSITDQFRALLILEQPDNTFRVLGIKHQSILIRVIITIPF